MWLANDWKDYEIIDASGGEKLERWGKYILIRPDPQIIWETKKNHPGWSRPDAHYHRSDSGGGKWEFFTLPRQWQIRYELKPRDEKTRERDASHGEHSAPGPTLTFNLKPFSFKHTGIFPEQAANWNWIYEKITSAGRPVRMLNLFAYTGGATLAAAAAGASVTHVDASKGMTGWARENAASSSLSDAHVRWLVDDCVKFVRREIRRGSKYDAIVMDPPSYGRGPNGEIWKMEDMAYNLIGLCEKLLSDEPLFFIVSSYTAGLAPGVLSYMLSAQLQRFKGHVRAEQLGLPVTVSGLALPCGSCARWER